MTFTYTVKAHPTTYRGTQFRSRLEARYAAYFDLCDFDWQYEPIDFSGWTPDFKVTVRCYHSECNEGFGLPGHVFWVEIKPYDVALKFDGHACQRFNKAYQFSAIGLGLHPLVETGAEFTHGAGGGEERLSEWVRNDVAMAWAEAGNRTRWTP